MNSSTVAKVAGGGALLGGIGTGGAYLSTKESIWSQVEKECIPNSLKDEDIWKKAQDKLEAAQEDVLSKNFKEIKQQITSAQSSDTKKTKGAYLMEGCFDLYSQNFKTIFSETKEEKLIDNIKTYCSLKIKDMLGADNLIAENADDSVWKAAQEKFKNTSSGNLGDKFRELHERVSQIATTENGAELKEKCKEFYTSFIKSKSLVDDVSKNCSYTIEDKLTTTLTFNNKGDTDADMDAIKEKMKTVTDSSSPFNAYKGKENDNGKWKEYRAECQKLYAKQWKGDNDTNYTLANTNCKKNPPVTSPAAPQSQAGATVNSGASGVSTSTGSGSGTTTQNTAGSPAPQGTSGPTGTGEGATAAPSTQNTGTPGKGTSGETTGGGTTGGTPERGTTGSTGQPGSTATAPTGT